MKILNYFKKKTNIEKYFIFWTSLEKLFHLFHIKHYTYQNHYDSWTLELSSLCSNSQYIEIINYINQKLTIFSLNVISSLDIVIFNKLYSKFKIWSKLMKKERNLINKFKLDEIRSIVNLSTQPTSIYQDTTNIYYDGNIQNNKDFCIHLFNITKHFLKHREKREKIKLLFKNIHNNDIVNLRQIYCLATYLKSKKIIKLIKKNYSIKESCKNYFNIDVDNNIKSKKLLEILTITNIYDI